MTIDQLLALLLPALGLLIVAKLGMIRGEDGDE